MNLQTLKKPLATLAVVGTAAALAGLGTFATFTSSTSASHTICSGTVSIALGATAQHQPAHRRCLQRGSGDTIQRSVDLINNGGQRGQPVLDRLTTTASPSSLLDTEPTSGLQMVIEKCSVAWTESASPYTYTCSGTTTTVLACAL